MAQNMTVIRLVENPSEEPAAEKPKKRASNFKRPLLFIFLALVLAVICAASYKWFIYSNTHISTNNAYVETEVWQVNSRNLGFLKTVLVSENDHVTKGQLLAQLDDSDVEIELRYKEAKYKKTLADYQRAIALNKSKLVSNSDFETAQATLTATQADLDGSLLKQKFTQIVAPTNGILAKVSIHPGQFIQPGQSLMLLVEDKEFWVKANYKETDLKKVKRGMPVEVEIDAFPGETWNGKLESIYPSSGANMSLIPPENATGNFTKIVQRIPVKIKLAPKSGFELRSGMSAISTILVR